MLTVTELSGCSTQFSNQVPYYALMRAAGIKIACLLLLNLSRTHSQIQNNSFSQAYGDGVQCPREIGYRPEA
jgi:hypothetical protein